MDESTTAKGLPNSFEKANVISQLSFWWLKPCLVKGFKKILQEEDLYAILPDDSAKCVYETLQNEWDKQLNGKENAEGKPSLKRSIWNVAWRKLLLFGFFYFIKFFVFGFSVVCCLGFIIRSLEEKTVVDYRICIYVALAIFIYACGVILLHNFTYHLELMSMRFRIACCSMIYRKVLRLSTTMSSSTSSGKFFNVIAGDVSRFDQLNIFHMSVFLDPVGAVIIFTYLYLLYGTKILTGASVLVALVIPLIIASRKFSSIRIKKSKATDKRLKLVNGILNDIKVIKMYCWESPFKSMIYAARRNELISISATMALRAFSMTIYSCSATLAMFVTILTTVLTGHQLQVEMLFVTYVLFIILKLHLTFTFPNGVQKISELMVSLQRIQSVLLMDETEKCEDILHQKVMNSGVCSVDLKNITADWGQASTFRLTDISLSLSDNAMCMITGPNGSGKSSLLLVLLGEMLLKKGTVSIKGRLAYVAQEPWLFPASIRKNIVFSLPFDENLYRKVLDACALNEDLDKFSQGDASFVGDNGVTLSGGQKARIHLARAIYRQADIYLLDDCLSALDARVEDHIFKKCFNQLIGNSLRILVTHQLKHVTSKSKLVIMNNGEIVKQSSCEEIQNTMLSPEVRMGEIVMDHVEVKLNNDKVNGETSEEKQGDQEVIWKPLKTAEEHLKESSLDSYLIYFKVLESYIPMVSFILVHTFTILVEINFELWLSIWSNAEAMSKLDANADQSFNALFSNAAHHSSFRIDVFGYTVSSQFHALLIMTYITASLITVTAIRSVMFFAFSVLASRDLHERLIKAVLKSKMQFFYETPLGRIINRFSNDMEAIDTILPIALYDEIVNMSCMLLVVVTIVIIQHWFLLPTILMAMVFVVICLCYYRATGFVSRVESIRRSPVFTLLSNSMQGHVTIKACEAQDVLGQEYDKHQDSHSMAWILSVAIVRCLAIYMEAIIVTFIAIILVSLLLTPGTFTASEIGLMVALMIKLSGTMQYGVRQAAEVENKITSVERVDEYSKLPSEHGYEIQLPEGFLKDWPKLGHIEFANVTLSYSEQNPPALKELNFRITAGEKIGIIGRTGSGKSSLVTALFRLHDIMGDIEIDGVNTATVPLSLLRKSFSIIPQDPVLFAASIRYNIDPCSEHSDEDIWQALEEVQIKPTIFKMDQGLDAMVSEGGSNFSLGQRQMLCLCRAILKRSKIILMDEATSNCDIACEAVVRHVLKTRFYDRTVLIIAHRLDTVMDCDRVMVMSNGIIMEFDKPCALLRNKETEFSKFVSHSRMCSSTT